MVEESSARAYNSWWQFRSDAWSRLEEASRQLADASLRGQPADGFAETVSGMLDVLAPIEQYWAFPGPEACRKARDLFAAASYEGFARTVARINRALVTESYRTGQERSPLDGDDEQVSPLEAAAEQAAPGRPYFEVLLVEALTPAQEHALREEVRGSAPAGRSFLLRTGRGEQRRGRYPRRAAEREPAGLRDPPPL